MFLLRKVRGGEAANVKCFRQETARHHVNLFLQTMTYRELLHQLQQLGDDLLNYDVCVYDTGVDEYYQLNVQLVFADQECDVLGLDHPVIQF